MQRNIEHNNPENNRAEHEEKFLELRRQLMLRVRRNEPVLIKGIDTDEAKEKIIGVLSELPVDWQVIDGDILLTYDWDQMTDTAKQDVIILNVDLGNEEQGRKLLFFRARASEEERPRQVLIAKPSTSSSVPSDHPCFNWTTNLDYPK